MTYSYVTTGDLTRLAGVTLSDNVGNESYHYDVEGRLDQQTQTFSGISNSLVTNYTIDTLDRLSQLTYPTQYGASGLSKTAAYSFDLASRLSSATYASSTMATVSDYNAASQILGLTLGNALTENYTYDAQTGLPATQNVKQGTTSLVDLGYGYADGNGKKTGQLLSLSDNKNSHRSRTYSYDKLGRLMQVSGTSSGGAWQQNYSYDRYGNRTSVTRSGVGASVVPLDAIVDSGNQNTGTLSFTNAQNQTLTNRITTVGYSYDTAGNLTRGQAPDGSWQNYKYDSANRLSQVTTDGGSVLASYSYGASNQRLIASDNNGAVVTYYAWSGGQVIAEYTQSGTSLVFQKSYVYLGGRLLATETADQSKQYHHPDRLGTRMATDGSGNVISENVVLPFGTMLAAGTTLYGDNSYQSTTQSNPSKRFFTSYDRSQTTQLDHAVNRHYNAGQGRFTQVDPIGMSAASLEDPQTLNLYAYCGNDPVNRVDPDGLFFGWLKKLFGAIKKFFSNIFVKIAVLVALTIISIGAASGTWALWFRPVLETFSIGDGVAAASAVGALHATTLGWVTAGLVAASGIGLPSFGSLGGFMTPSTFPGGGGVSGVNSLLQQRRRRGTQWDEALGKRIAQIAKRNIGETAWETSRERRGRDGKIHKAGTYKCSTFVFDVLKAAGAPAPTSGGGGEWNATAGEWGNPDVDILGGRWKIVKDGSLKPGDVISHRFTNIGAGTGATGHVALIGPDLETIGTGIPGGVITSTNWGTGRDTEGVVVRRCIKP